MDYRARHPELKSWPKQALESIQTPFPYCEPNTIAIYQISAPDDQTQFLGVSFDFSPDETYFIAHIIEAPQDCPIRKEFEFGDITWEQFWYHRGWLIELRIPFEEEPLIEVRYILPSQMTEKTKRHIMSMTHSPMECKLKALELCANTNWPHDWHVENHEDDLDEFRKKYPQIPGVDPKAA